jgi:hypothetical protein
LYNIVIVQTSSAGRQGSAGTADGLNLHQDAQRHGIGE